MEELVISPNFTIEDIRSIRQKTFDMAAVGFLPNLVESIEDSIPMILKYQRDLLKKLRLMLKTNQRLQKT